MIASSESAVTSGREESRDQRILVLAPRGKDAVLARDALNSSGLSAQICADLETLGVELATGAGAILIAEEALPPHRVDLLATSLDDEPSWSELPVVVLMAISTREGRPYGIRHLGQLRNVTMLDRPVRIATLVSTMQAALRARRRQYECRDLMAELRRALQTRDELIASVSHELRTPLNVILGWTATMLRRSGDAERTKEAASILERNARVLWQLVEDLIDVSRIASGRVQLRLGPVDLVSAVRTSIDTLRPSAQTKRVTLNCVVDTDVRDVYGDEVRLQQVVWNLMWNALKFTPAGGRIDVQLRAVENGAEIVIADTGIGIDPGFLPHVFEPFRQGTPSGSDPSRGLGLGLAIVRHLVELHGGTIEAQSEGIGRGARFRVTLPAAEAEGLERTHVPSESQTSAAL
jgi:two-component system, sensor histidine kinase